MRTKGDQHEKKSNSFALGKTHMRTGSSVDYGFVNRIRRIDAVARSSKATYHDEKDFCFIKRKKTTTLKQKRIPHCIH
jgi:hypothetical protein